MYGSVLVIEWVKIIQKNSTCFPFHLAELQLEDLTQSPLVQIDYLQSALHCYDKYNAIEPIT